jgi:hypothetical protein
MRKPWLKLDIEDMVVWSGFRQDMPHVLNAMTFTPYLHCGKGYRLAY